MPVFMVLFNKPYNAGKGGRGWENIVGFPTVTDERKKATQIVQVKA